MQSLGRRDVAEQSSQLPQLLPLTGYFLRAQARAKPFTTYSPPGKVSTISIPSFTAEETGIRADGGSSPRGRSWYVVEPGSRPDRPPEPTPLTTMPTSTSPHRLCEEVCKEMHCFATYSLSHCCVEVGRSKR